MSFEIVTIAQMRAIDAAAARAGVATRTLMENAGRAVADAITARFTPGPTAVLCGPGNNGGDGWVVARLLRERGWPVWAEALAPQETLAGDAAVAADAWLGETKRIGADDPMAELFVDALFGAGLSRPLEGHAARLAQALPAERVVAIDVPSGLHGDIGRAQGDICFGAALTVTFARKKPAHVLFPGRAYCGEIVVADIGAPAAAIAEQAIALWENDPSLWLPAWPWPGWETHKHARGHVLVASGPATRTGAARLAARAALRVGAGLVTIAAAPVALAEHAAQLNAIMLSEARDEAGWLAAMVRKSCVVVGPAFGTTAPAEQAFDAMLGASDRPAMVLDADALTMIARGIGRESLRADDVLTPHVGEFRRLCPDVLEQSPSRIHAAREAAHRFGCTVLLKGADTVVAAANGRAIVNTTGTPFLATAGAGDVLAGIIAGVLAQGAPSFEASATGAWLHGKAGEALGIGLISEDLPENLPLVLKTLGRREPGCC
ncbi:MAG: NAD(P)H-hydrate dehydratase [Terricaulis sp.]